MCLKRKEDIKRFIINKKSFLIPVALGIFCFVILFSTRTMQLTGDSLNYALSAKNGTNLFHPHHLLYNLSIRISFLILSAINSSFGIILSAQIHNILWSIIALLTVYFIVRRLTNRYILSTLAVMLLLFSQGFWRLSTQAETYIPASGCIGLIILILAHNNKQLTLKRLCMIAVLQILAVLYHQINMLFFIPLGIYMFIVQKNKLFKSLIITIFIPAFFIVLAYTLAMLSRHKELTLNNLMYFFTQYAHFNNPEWGTFTHFGSVGFKKFLFAHVQSFFAFTRKSHKFFIFLLHLISLLVIGLNIIQMKKKGKGRLIVALLLLFLFIYYLFFIWWLPQEYEFHSLTSFALIILAFTALNDMVSRITDKKKHSLISLATAFIIVTMAIGNFQTRILPFHKSKGRWYVRAEEINFLDPDGCLIVDKYHTVAYSRFYFKKNNSLTASRLVNPFYKHKKPSQPFNKNKCILISLDTMSPKKDHPDPTGYTNPKEWLNFIEYLFGFEYDSNHNLIACRDFKIVSKEGKNLFILLSDNKMPLNSLAGFFKALDNQIGKYPLYREKDIFQKWLDTAYRIH